MGDKSCRGGDAVDGPYIPKLVAINFRQGLGESLFALPPGRVGQSGPGLGIPMVHCQTTYYLWRAVIVCSGLQVAKSKQKLSYPKSLQHAFHVFPISLARVILVLEAHARTQVDYPPLGGDGGISEEEARSFVCCSHHVTRKVVRCLRFFL